MLPRSCDTCGHDIRPACGVPPATPSLGRGHAGPLSPGAPALIRPYPAEIGGGQPVRSATFSIRLEETDQLQTRGLGVRSLARGARAQPGGGARRATSGSAACRTRSPSRLRPRADVRAPGFRGGRRRNACTTSSQRLARYATAPPTGTSIIAPPRSPRGAGGRLKDESVARVAIVRPLLWGQGPLRPKGLTICPILPSPSGLTPPPAWRPGSTPCGPASAGPFVRPEP
jgi:hypothetical protein